MRISRLSLKAYGQFTDAVLEFGDAPGLHVVLGDNEAGKSTTLRALSSVLFGYPHHAVDTFRHDTLNIAVGAELVAKDGRRLDFVRRRRGKQLLATTDGQPLTEGDVTVLLGHASQDLFERVFALDHHRLRQHAQALLLDGGALGLSLVEAGAGVTGVKEVIDGLSAKARTLFLPTGQNPRINTLIRQLVQLRKEARSQTVSPDHYQKLEAELAGATAAVQENRSQIATLRATLNRLERIRRNLPRRTEIAAIVHQLQSLGAIPLLSADAPAQRQQAKSDGAAARRRLADALAKIAQIDEMLSKSTVDTALLARRADIAALTDRRGAIAKDHTDRPAVERNLTQERERASDLLRQAELTGDVENLDAIIPSAVKRQAITSLIDTAKVVSTRRTAAQERLDAAAAELATSEQALEKLPAAVDTSALEAAIREADGLGDVDTELDRRRRRLASDRQILRERCIGLGVADGDIGALRHVAVPARALVRQFADDFARLDKAIDLLDNEIERQQQEAEAKASQAATLRATDDIVSEEQLAGLRRQRDHGWQLIRGRYLDGRQELDAALSEYAGTAGGAGAPGAAAAYERQTAAADHAADAMRNNASSVATLTLLEAAVEAAEAKIAAATDERNERLASRGTLQQNWAALWANAIPSPDNPPAMSEWLDKRDDLLARDAALAGEEADLAALSENTERIATTLRHAVAAHDQALEPNANLTAIRDTAKRLQTRLARANQQQRLAEQSVADKAARRSAAQIALTAAERATGEWQATWQQALAAAGLAPDLTAEQGAAILQSFRDLQHASTTIRSLARRVSGMTRDIDAFNANVAKLWQAIACEAMPDDHLIAARMLEDRLKSADEAAQRHADLGVQRQAEETIAAATRQDIADTDAIIDRLCADAKCDDAAQLPAIEEQSQRKRKLTERREQLEADMLHDGAGMALSEMLAECAGVSGDALPPEIDSLKENEDRLEQQYRRLVETETNLRAEFDRLLASEQATTLTQRAVNTEVEIADAVDAYACLAFEEAMLKAAIELYRERHQGPVLPRARTLFAELTNGAYRGLAVDNDESSQSMLIAERSDGTHLDLAALSDGTLDPLYLALRLAVVQEYNDRQEPLPFIADDLLLTLDDNRAQAAFRALSQIAISGQVLFFTHNPHMLALARDAVPASLLAEHRLAAAA